MSRWRLGTPGLDRDPLSPWYGEVEAYEVVAPGRGALVLHPSRVVRFLGNPWPDPSVAPTPWSDSVLQALSDAVHAVALTVAGATSLMHEAKVDVVTVPILSEHLSSAETTNQLSARFGTAAAMTSINNLLLLGDGETWNRQRIDFAGLPEMVRTFLQVAAGAADIPVTRLLGQSPTGLSATGGSDTRNYYDNDRGAPGGGAAPGARAARSDRCRERGDRPGCADLRVPASVAARRRDGGEHRAAEGAGDADLCRAESVARGHEARLVEAQLASDGTYPNLQAVFGESLEFSLSETAREAVSDYVGQPRDPLGQFAEGRQSAAESIIRVAENEDPDSHRIKLLDPFRLEVGPTGRIHLPEFWAVDPPSSPGSYTQQDPRAAQKLDDALSDYQTRRYTVGNQTFQLDKAGMHDILERHAPEYWDGSIADTQTFFPRGTSIEQLQDVVRDVLSENRDEIIADPSAYRFDLKGTSGGVRYDVGIYRGRINHLVPK